MGRRSALPRAPVDYECVGCAGCDQLPNIVPVLHHILEVQRTNFTDVRLGDWKVHLIAQLREKARHPSDHLTLFNGWTHSIPWLRPYRCHTHVQMSVLVGA